MAMRRNGLRLRLDPVACEGHGLCADLLPELIWLDEWGYPVIREDVPPELARHARRAAADCPALALRLRRGTPGGDAPERGPRHRRTPEPERWPAAGRRPVELIHNPGRA